MHETDVPITVDFKIMSVAQEWESNAMKRPFRIDFFEAFLHELQSLNLNSLNILELGSGPGFLAEFLLSKMPSLSMSLLDNSLAMHTLAKKRLEPVLERVQFIERDFKQNNWTTDLGKFDAVITLQAVHELRHKRYATEFHRQARTLLKENGVYLFCDHYYDGELNKNNQLNMSLAEQHQSLENAGFIYSEVLNKGGRALYCAT